MRRSCVTSSASIPAAAAAIEGSGHNFEVLIDNAGMALVMPCLDTDLGGAREVFETNMWGGLMLVQASRRFW